MNQVLKQENDVTVFADGNVTISQRKLAKLCGVSQEAVRKYALKVVTLKGTNTNGFSAKQAFEVVTYYAFSGRKEAQEMVLKAGEAGMKAYLYHEAGYQFEAIKKTEPVELIKNQLAEAIKKLSYCSIHEDSPKSVFELRDNAKVNAIKESWVEMGYLSKRVVMRPITEYDITPEGSEHLYFDHKKIRVKPEAKHDIKLLTHGFNLGRHGQSDIFLT